MSYQVIARKWRPQIFEEVVGQEAITQTLCNAVKYERLHHAYLFSGARGVGKTTCARLLAKALNCHKTEKPTQNPCHTTSGKACVSCREIAESRSLDVLEFDAASHTKVDEIREIILEDINVNPSRDRFKVFIIDEVHMLSSSSFNALLKTLEEPPPNVVFIMATTEPHKVPETILSRCQEFEFRTIALKKILERLKKIAEAENVTISDEGLWQVARSGRGSMRDAQSNFDQVISFSRQTIETEDVLRALGIVSSANLANIFKAIENKTPQTVFEVVEDLIARGYDLRNFCRELLGFTRDLMVSKMTDSDTMLENSGLSGKELRECAKPFSEKDLIRFFSSIAETDSKMREASEPRYLLEIGLVKLIEMRKVVELENILKRLANLEKAIGKSDKPIEIEQAGFIQREKETNVKHSLTAGGKSLSPSTRFLEAAADNPRFRDQNETSKEISQPIRQEGNITSKKKEARMSNEWKNDSRSEEIPAEDKKSERLALKDSSAAAQDINPDFMPIKLPPISSEDLEHVEDELLDKEFEARLQKEGDDLGVINNAHEIVEGLLSQWGKGEPLPQAEIIDGKGLDVHAAAGVVKNKALNIVSEIASIEEIDETIPSLPKKPTKKEMWQYAENHPLVKKVKRVFRGRLVKVERNKD